MRHLHVTRRPGRADGHARARAVTPSRSWAAGRQTPCRDDVYSVVVAFELTARAEPRTCLPLCTRPAHPSAETIRWLTRRPGMVPWVADRRVAQTPQRCMRCSQVRRGSRWPTVEETLGEPCEVSGASFEGDGGVLVLWTILLVSSSIRASVCHITRLDVSQTALIHTLEG